MKPCLNFFLLVLSRPAFALLSGFAFIKTKITAEKTWRGSRRSSAFRAYENALLGSLVMMYCCKISSPRKSAAWARRIAELTEQVFTKNPSAQEINLHNINVGVSHFFELLPGVHRQFFETSFFVPGLLSKIKNAEGKPEAAGPDSLIIAKNNEGIY
ncbi:DUF6973 domain-containing protein [Cruoricaptor ignavus]|uniref:DUF6973 domain-containing protein n=1 Tax=Cruoricaptor ignavus TaxID=1118202 RepID=UPI000933684C|nr:hypothetical protein [Cruoricaptor ignavus]